MITLNTIKLSKYATFVQKGNGMRTKQAKTLEKKISLCTKVRLCEVLLNYSDGENKLVEVYLDVSDSASIKEQVYQHFDPLSYDYPKLIDYTLCYVKQDLAEKEWANLFRVTKLNKV